MKVHILSVAKQDLKDISHFYDSQQPGSGKRIRDSLRKDIRSLSSIAGIHAWDYGCQRMLATKFPHAIFYRVHGGAAIVIAVLDMRRDPHWIIATIGKR
jgi:plasmid stabilization system protein ParE